MSIMGTAVGLPTPTADWAQTDSGKADFIRNKPDVDAIRTLAQEGKTLAENALPKSGGTMTGTLNMGAEIAMGGNKVTGLGAPEDDGDAANKAYVDGKTAPGALYSPTTATAGPVYNLSAKDAGRTILAWSTADVTFVLDHAANLAFPDGSEIAVVYYSATDVRITFSGDYFFIVPGDTTFYQNGTIRLTDPHSIVGLKKLNGLCWMVTGPVEVIL